MMAIRYFAVVALVALTVAVGGCAGANTGGGARAGASAARLRPAPVTHRIFPKKNPALQSLTDVGNSIQSLIGAGKNTKSQVQTTAKQYR